MKCKAAWKIFRSHLLFFSALSPSGYCWRTPGNSLIQARCFASRTNSLVLRCFERLRRLSLARGLKRLRGNLWANREGSAWRSRLCLGTRLPTGAGTTVLHRTCDFADGVASPIRSGGSTAPCFAHRAGRALVLPIHHQRLGGEARRVAGLPVGIVPGWPKEIHSPALTADHFFRRNVAGLHQVHCWQEIVLLKRLVHDWHGVIIGQGQAWARQGA